MTINLLITMRDIAASAHLVEVFLSCKCDKRYNVTLAAQEPASSFLKYKKIQHIKISHGPVHDINSDEAISLLATASALIKKVKPDAVLVGLSTPGDGGIDEAVLAVAHPPIKKYLFQDFWGEQNDFFGTSSDKIFVLDHMAAKRNQQRFNKPSIICGSPRHGVYKKTDWPERRKNLRKTFMIEDNQKVIGFFGQALNSMPGYWRTVKAFIQAVERIETNILVALRPHPRESEFQRNKTYAYFQNSSVRTLTVSKGTIEETLPLYDVVCSLFSNCTFDASYMNWFSNIPMCVPVSMLFDPEIANYSRERVHFEKLPIHTSKLVIPVYQEYELLNVLKNSITPEARQQAWQQAKDKLPNPINACQIIQDSIYSDIL